MRSDTKKQEPNSLLTTLRQQGVSFFALCSIALKSAGQRQKKRAEAARERKMYHYYSLDRGNGIENDALYQPPTPEEIILEQVVREELYTAVIALPEKQAKRIHAHFYLGMSKLRLLDRKASLRMLFGKALTVA